MTNEPCGNGLVPAIHVSPGARKARIAANKGGRDG
jgi:hypothetical protein